MNFAIEETVQGIIKLKSIKQQEFVDGVRQAAEGALNESVVFAHIHRGAAKDEKVYKYHDTIDREIDVVIINREERTLRLIEVKSTSNINPKNVFIDEAKHLFNSDIIKNMGADDTFSITRVVAYMGSKEVIPHEEGNLLLVNIEDLLNHYKDLGHFLDEMSVNASKLRKGNEKSSLLAGLDDAKKEAKMQNAKQKPAPEKKTKRKTTARDD
jgi:hypothetical protein